MAHYLPCHLHLSWDASTVALVCKLSVQVWYWTYRKVCIAIFINGSLFRIDHWAVFSIAEAFFVGFFIIIICIELATLTFCVNFCLCWKFNVIFIMRIYPIIWNSW